MRVFRIDCGYTIRTPAVRGECFRSGGEERGVVVFGWDQSPGADCAGPPASPASGRQRQAATRLPKHASHFVDNAKPRGGDEERAIPGRTLLPDQWSSLAAAPATRSQALLEFFFKKYVSLFEKPEPKISESTMSLLLRHGWPGNIRELENVARKIVALGDEHLATHDLISENKPKAAESFPGASKMAETGYSRAPTGSLKEAARAASRVAERAMILNQLERTHWNRKRAARELQISYKALLYKLKQLGLDGSDQTKEQ
jgi:hypothetical protein